MTPQRQAWGDCAERHTRLGNILTSWPVAHLLQWGAVLAFYAVLFAAVTWLHGLAA